MVCLFLVYARQTGELRDILQERASSTSLERYLVDSKFLLLRPELRQHVTRFEEISEETQRLESIYRQKLSWLDELKKSLLHQAFRGEL